MKKSLFVVMACVMALALGISSVSAGSTEAKLTASDGAADEWFGYSLAISGDTAVVGSPWDDWRGSAFVFQRTADGTWTEQQKLTASDGAEYDMFGNSVAMSEDTIIVGSPCDDGTGSAYVYVLGPDGAWTQEQKLTAGASAPGAWFGHSLALSGDTMVVGAPWDDDKGSAYVFQRMADGTWVEQQKLVASDGTAYDLFAQSIGISGNVIVIGSPSNDSSGTDSGSAYVFQQGPDGSWTEQQKLNASDCTAYDWFGYSARIIEGTIVVGSPWDDDMGSAYVYQPGTDGAWTLQQKLTAGDGEVGDGFGASGAIRGNVIVVGSPNDNGNGSAYVFECDVDGVWIPLQKLTASDGGENDLFGYAVVIGTDTIVVGAPSDDDGGIDAGSAYAYSAEVKDPVTLIGELIDDVTEINLSQGDTGLDNGLDVAVKNLDDENPKNDNSALKVIQAFINRVDAQSGKKIPVEDADELIAQAQAILAALIES